MELSKQIAAQQEHITTIKLTYKGDLLISKLTVWVPAWGTEPNSAQQREVEKLTPKAQQATQ